MEPALVTKLSDWVTQWPGRRSSTIPNLNALVKAADYEAFKRSRRAYGFGLYVAGPATFLGVRGFTEAGPVLNWWAVHYFVHTLSVITAFLPATNARISRHGLPWGFLPTTVVALTILGSLMLFDPAASEQPDFVLACVSLTFGMGAALLAAFGTNATLTRIAMLAQFTPVIVAFSLQSRFNRGLGFIAFLLLVGGWAVGRARTGFVQTLELQATIQAEAEQSEWMAAHDPLTSLLNRFGLMDAFTNRRISTVSAALFVDLDRFKQVNDRLGHPAGDELLRQAARRLEAVVGKDGVVTRLGGDEFLVVITSPMSVADDLGQLIVDRLSDPFVIGAATAHVSASVGITKPDNPREALAELLRTADLAVYKAKRTGRSRVVSYDADLKNEMADRALLQEQLHEMVETEILTFWGQPIYGLKNGEVAMVELLARWPRPDGSFVSPDLFIPLAEELGLLEQIAELALERAIESRRAWSDHELLRDTTVTINLSPTCLSTRFIEQRFLPVLERSGIDNSKLMLEITEHSAIEHREQVVNVLRQLETSKVGLALDDFGTGFSSLSELLSFPLQTIKIDQTLIQGTEGTSSHQHAVAAIAELATRLGREVVAEGIENESHLAVMREIGIDYVQGYLLCRPLPLSELPERAGGYFARKELDVGSHGAETRFNVSRWPAVEPLDL